MKQPGRKQGAEALQQPRRPKAQEKGINALDHRAMVQSEQQGGEKCRRPPAEPVPDQAEGLAAENQLLHRRNQQAGADQLGEKGRRVEGRGHVFGIAGEQIGEAGEI